MHACMYVCTGPSLAQETLFENQSLGASYLCTKQWSKYFQEIGNRGKISDTQYKKDSCKNALFVFFKMHFLYVCMDGWMDVCMYVHMYVCMYVCNVCMYVIVCMHACMYVCMYA